MSESDSGIIIQLGGEKNLSDMNINSYDTYIKSMPVLSKATIFSMDLSEKIKIRDDHPVFNSFVDAYRNDRPVTISPDIIWLLIVQGFSNHVNFHAEKLRSKFVNFYGQKTLHTFRDSIEFTKEDYKSIIPQFVEQIEKYTGKEIIDTLTPNFSTTTPVTITSAQLSIMCAMKHYFRYVSHACICHFPFVVIEGKKADWEEILRKLDVIEKYNLKQHFLMTLTIKFTNFILSFEIL